MHTTRIAIPLLLTLLLPACATSKAGDVYTREQTRQTQTVKTGTVESVRTVRIEGTKSGVGAATGAVVGGIAGSELGEGKGELLGAVVGAVAGGLAGAAVEEAITRTEGVEITVRLDSGELVTVAQEGTETFQPGEYVRILQSGGVTRVSH